MISNFLHLNNNVAKALEYRAHIEGKYELVNDTSVTVSINGHHAKADQKAYQLVFSCGPLKREDSLLQTKIIDADESWLAVEAEEDSPAAEAIATRPLTRDPKIGGTLRIAKEWIDACVASHEKCQLGYVRTELENAGLGDDEGRRLRTKYSEDGCELPTRVIDVEAFEDSVRLVETATTGAKGRYVALSHVWGKAEHFKTERNTFTTYLTRIALSRLPRTFLDAVFVTRELGVRYLWIDSLCIIQDCPSDWAREASRMASVYMNAYVTISATSAVNSDRGLFLPRQAPECSVQLTYSSPTSGSIGTWIIHNSAPSWSYQVRQSILASRAWTLQEKQLSRRTLHFASDQVSFECKKGFELETRRPCNNIDPGSLDMQLLYWVLVEFWDRNSASVTKLLSALVMRVWVGIIEDYTIRKLTFESDKLAAIEGLASYVASLTQDRYVFGLWRDSLENGLLWRTASYKNVKERRGRVRARAPSWSWASMDGRVYFAFAGEMQLEHHDPVAEIIDVDSHGKLSVIGGLVRLRRGGLGTGEQWEIDQSLRMFSYMLDAKTPSVVSLYEYVRSDDHKWYGWAAMDDGTTATALESDGGKQSEVVALLLKKQVKESADPMVALSTVIPFNESYLVLFVESVSEEQTYQRVGMGQIFPCEKIEKVKNTQISII
jgi:hypothetical protein